MPHDFFFTFCRLVTYGAGSSDVVSRCVTQDVARVTSHRPFPPAARDVITQRRLVSSASFPPTSRARATVPAGGHKGALTTYFYRATLWLVDCIHTAEDIVKLLSQPNSPIILVFFDPGANTRFQGESLQRWRKIQWVGKFCVFRLKSLSISETVRDRPMVATKR